MYVVPILHPAYILRGMWALDPVQPEYLALALALARGELTPPLVERAPPHAIIEPTLEDLAQWKAGPAGVAVDIETAGPHLVCIGFARADDEAYICIRFRKQGAKKAYEDLMPYIEFAYDLLADPNVPKIFHNGQEFDVPQLVDAGFVVNNFNFDTLIAHHILWAEMPKRLEFLASAYCGVPGWKYLVNEDEQGEDK